MEHIFAIRDGGGLEECRESIVRCRDCVKYDREDEMCMRDPDHTGRGWHANPDGFCAWSEPRKED